jgi:hypothetical protein
MQSAALQDEKNLALNRKLFFYFVGNFFHIVGAVAATAPQLGAAWLSIIFNYSNTFIASGS